MFRGASVRQTRWVEREKMKGQVPAEVPSEPETLNPKPHPPQILIEAFYGLGLVLRFRVRAFWCLVV